MASKLIAVCALAFATAAGAEAKVLPSLKLLAEERYDDDLLLRTDGAAGGQLLTKVSPQAGLQIKAATGSLDAWYAADLLYHSASRDLSLDHRGALAAKKKLSSRAELSADVQVWRVSDPTSLPRAGMARTLAPVLYGKADLSARYALSARWTGRVGYRFEGAKIYEEDNPGGVMHAPFAELTYGLSRRAELGAMYRLQLFSSGPEQARGNGALALFRYRLNPVTVFTARGGPVFYKGNDGSEGIVPALTLELAREAQGLELAAQLGHDLVGASGFTAALWADYATAMGGLRFSPRFKVFAAASYFRNGRAPDEDFGSFRGGAAATGYAVGGGAEWTLTRNVSLQVTVDRIAQLGVPGPVAEAIDLSRNIAAARLLVTAF